MSFQLWFCIPETEKINFNVCAKLDPYKVEMTEKNILTMSDYEIHVIDLETNQEITVLKDDDKQVALNDF